MIEQFEVFEEQNVSVIPYVFRVGTGEGQYADSKAAEAAARAKFHSIMDSVYSGNNEYHGALIIHRYGTNRAVIDDDEMVERTVTA